MRLADSRAETLPLRRQKAYGDRAAPNMLVCGDNLEVLQRLAATTPARFKLVYVDPPYNTGRVFKEYKDARRPDEWRAMMKPRLELLASMLAKDGVLVAEIDDTELAALISLLDQVFGRDGRVSIVTVVRSAPTGHKAINRGPINVADYLLVYAKDKRAFRPNALVRRRRGRDPAYNTVLVHGDRAPHEWRFEPLGRVVASENGYPSKLAATRAMGSAAFEALVERFCLDQPERVVRFAQPRYEAVSNEARAAIDRSRANPEEVIVVARAHRPPIILRAGNRLLFSKDKVRTFGKERCFVEPLTNVWDDIPFQGLAREGGVTFSRNKKPERLLARIIELFTAPGDWVLDPFLGSGTTAAVAHKLGRTWVGIESSTVLFEGSCIPRLQRVISGEDNVAVASDGTAARNGGGFGAYV